ncbi:hypothetical protein BGW42_003559 [Actinomortierella wolfii]|nr:hypothetical protein BGW41_001708 [Actinomortierella wolfii]KAG0236401.1 hypothetical protein BGW42_003559 [Actinomortierella wolfii]
MTLQSRLAFIGGGNMAEAILGGLLSVGYPLSKCVVSEPLKARCDFLHEKYPGLQIFSGPTGNQAAITGSVTDADSTTQLYVSPASSTEAEHQPAEVVILAVKPQMLRSVVVELGPVLRERKPLVISIAAGIDTSAIARFMAEGTNVSMSELPPVIRCMPNTPSLALEGATGLYATSDATAEHRSLAEALLGAVSKKVCWVDQEPLMDTVTALSGSGPAYFFLMMEAMEDAAVNLGMDRDTARALAIQTAVGAAKMAATSSDDLKTLRMKVTSPNGTTDAAIKSFEAQGFREIVQNAVNAAEARGRSLCAELGGAKL